MAEDKNVTNLINRFERYIVRLQFVPQEDVDEIRSIIAEVMTISGDINAALKSWNSLHQRIGWLKLDYERKLAAVNKAVTRTYEDIYLAYRRNQPHPKTGVKLEDQGERVSGQLARQDPLVRAQEDKRDTLDEMVKFINQLADGVEDRKPILEQISNNLRADLRNEQAQVPD